MPELLRWDMPGIHFDDPQIFWDGFVPESSNTNNVMPSDNRISATIAPAIKADVLAAIQDIRNLLPFLVNLTMEERKELPKIGDKTIAFDNKCAGYMVARPELVPGFVDMAELAKDRALMIELSDIDRELAMVCEAVRDTLSLAGSEAYMADLSFYQSVRQATKRGVVGVDAIYSDLRERFPGRPAAQPTPPTP